MTVVGADPLNLTGTVLGGARVPAVRDPPSATAAGSPIRDGRAGG